MVTLSPRFGPRLLEELARIDDGRLPVAEVWRRVGAAADRLGVTRPGYEGVRVLVHQFRRVRARPTTADVMVDIAFRVRPPQALVEHLSGVGVPEHPRRS